MSQASVSLLYQELSRWADLRVISDDRVADLLRDVPAAQQSRLGLTAGLALARRAGAGRLILGDYLAVGGSAQVAAKVYDVRSGRLVRTVRDRLAGFRTEHGLDSLSAAFGRLARAALALPLPSRTRSSTVGTSSLAAYSEYAAGLAHYRTGFSDSALPRFQRALAIDSGFALPAMRLLEMNFADAPRFLDIAARSPDALPLRERLLLAAYRAVAVGEWDQVCGAAQQLLARDSSDAEAWFVAGACEEDQAVVAGPEGPRLARSLNRALAFYARALELDPAQPIVFARIVANLVNFNAAIRTGCSIQTVTCPADRQVVFVPVIRADTLAFERSPPALARGIRHPEQLEQLRWRWEKARALLARYVAANPRSWSGHAQFAATLMRLGDLAGAEREYAAASYAVHLPGDRRVYYRERIELALRSERPAEGRAYLDSMLSDTTSAQQPQYATVFGLFSRDVNFVPDSARSRVTEARTAFTPVFTGLPLAGYDSIEARLLRNAWPATSSIHSGYARLSTIAAFHWRRGGPALDSSAAEHPLVRFQFFFARGDAARARQLLQEITTATLQLPPHAPDDAQWLIGAESWLALGDSARALDVLQDWARRWPGFHHNIGLVLGQPNGMTSAVRFFPRAWLLFGDLSLAAGRPADARRAYRMVLGMWEGGEPPVQPIVARVRAALVQLGN